MLKVINGGFEPVRSTKYSAYVDLFARENVTIGAGETKIVKLGVKLDLELFKENNIDNFSRGIYGGSLGFIDSDFDEDFFNEFLSSHYLEVALRSSLGVKGLIIANGIGIIDLDYPDEIGLIVHNPYGIYEREHRTEGRLCGEVSIIETKKEPFKIKKGDKVAQCTLKEHRGYLMGYESDTIRDGGFGSTGL
jgi:dUTPase